MADALLPLQSALVNHLRSGSPILFPYTLHVGKAPQGANPPYAVMGEETATDWGTKTDDGQEITVTFHSWALDDNDVSAVTRVKQMMASLYAALHKQEFSVSGQTLVMCRFDFGQTLEDADGKTYHGISRFRLHLSAA